MLPGMRLRPPQEPRVPMSKREAYTESLQAFAENHIQFSNVQPPPPTLPSSSISPCLHPYSRPCYPHRAPVVA